MYWFGIDTNTQIIGGQRVSVTGIALGQKVTSSEGAEGLAWRCPFCVEFVDVVAGVEEKIGWIESLRELFRKGCFTNQHRVGVIVDAYLGELSDINSQKNRHL
jgi:hypothetical protein